MQIQEESRQPGGVIGGPEEGDPTEETGTSSHERRKVEQEQVYWKQTESISRRKGATVSDTAQRLSKMRTESQPCGLAAWRLLRTMARDVLVRCGGKLGWSEFT